MSEEKKEKTLQWEKLSKKEKVLISSKDKLASYFRKLERLGFIDRKKASEMIGAVYSLVSIADGSFKEDK